MSAPLACARLSVAPGGTVLVRDLDFACARGEIVALLGVNGAGKTSLLETLCGLRRAHRGQVQINGADITTLARKHVAQVVGLLPQRVEDSFVQQVLPLVAIGRYAQHGFWHWQDGQDLACAQAALEQVGLAGFGQRWTESLSGGERQRLALAMLLAQAPQVMLLDEPFSQLDPFHQLHIARLLRQLRDREQSIVMSVHDVNLAAHCADRVLLIFGNGETILGPTQSTLTDANLTRLYGTPMQRIPTAAGAQFSFLV